MARKTKKDEPARESFPNNAASVAEDEPAPPQVVRCTRCTWVISGDRPCLCGLVAEFQNVRARIHAFAEEISPKIQEFRKRVPADQAAVHQLLEQLFGNPSSFRHLHTHASVEHAIHIDYLDVIRPRLSRSGLNAEEVTGLEDLLGKLQAVAKELRPVELAEMVGTLIEDDSLSNQVSNCEERLVQAVNAVDQRLAKLRQEVLDVSTGATTRATQVMEVAAAALRNEMAKIEASTRGRSGLPFTPQQLEEMALVIAARMPGLHGAKVEVDFPPGKLEELAAKLASHWESDGPTPEQMDQLGAAVVKHLSWERARDFQSYCSDVSLLELQQADRVMRRYAEARGAVVLQPNEKVEVKEAPVQGSLLHRLTNRRWWFGLGAPRMAYLYGTASGVVLSCAAFYFPEHFASIAAGLFVGNLMVPGALRK